MRPVLLALCLLLLTRALAAEPTPTVGEAMQRLDAWEQRLERRQLARGERLLAHPAAAGIPGPRGPSIGPGTAEPEALFQHYFFAENPFYRGHLEALFRTRVAWGATPPDTRLTPARARDLRRLESGVAAWEAFEATVDRRFLAPLAALARQRASLAPQWRDREPATGPAADRLARRIDALTDRMDALAARLQEELAAKVFFQACR